MGDHARYAGRLDGASALHQLELVERGEEEDKKTILHGTLGAP